MSILNIVEWPAKVLETRAEEVTDFNEDLRSFVRDMFDTLEDSGGIGLAANQVGDLRRVLIIHIPFLEPDKDDLEPDPKEAWHDKKFVFVNPKIVQKSGKTKYMEGCLSFPEVYDFVDRAAEVKVVAHDEHGKEFEVDANALFAICLQHEIDHIDGIVFFKRMSRLKSSSVRKKMMKRAALRVAEES